MKFTLLLVPLLTLSLSAQEKKVPPPFEEKPSNVEATEGEEAADPFDPDAFDGNSPAMVQVQVEYIEMPHETLTDLLFMKRPTKSDATELRKEVQTLVKAGDAKVLETQILTGRSSEKCLVESINEQIYPTEAVPPKLPESVTVPDKPAGLSPDNIKAVAALISGPIPTSFETRNVGSTMDVEPTIGSDPKYIDLRLAPELVWRNGNTTWYERKDALGNVAKIELPDFYTIRLTTALTVTSGSYVLAGVVSPKAKDGSIDLTRKVMVFVKADVLPVR
ncbi:hypothetical protein OKA05_24695 [Luteolibacter arcticus]|uniref:Uncharacterized protein n=1 Tax=Luteolibacter arcticus TaxID=1581411 RepID=A0ABT3GQI3_9BACT|nr:hypothetical protein [Luteolibacter arcticus]MCW1925780.1 hypothetical protein [Luteolibacter arcticus]